MKPPTSNHTATQRALTPCNFLPSHTLSRNLTPLPHHPPHPRRNIHDPLPINLREKKTSRQQTGHLPRKKTKRTLTQPLGNGLRQIGSNTSLSLLIRIDWCTSGYLGRLNSSSLGSTSDPSENEWLALLNLPNGQERQAHTKPRQD